MSLALIGRGASYEFRWRRWALLRDTIQHHLEDGTSGAKFPRFASIGDALVRPPLQLPAAELAAEVETIAKALESLAIEQLVIGVSTSSILYMGAKLESPRPLSAGELAAIAPVGNARNLAEYFGSMLDSIRHVCAHPAADGSVEVIDG